MSKEKIDVTVECKKTKKLSLYYAGFDCNKNEVTMQAPVTNCNFGDTAYELNVLMFTFKTDVAQYEDK